MNKIYFCRAEKFKDFYEDGIVLLDKKRREKAERYVKEEDRILSFMTGLMLDKIIGVSDENSLLYSENGKPYVEHGPFFSISHSGKIAVLAVSEKEIGVDIEKPRNIDKNIVKRCFTVEEAKFTEDFSERFTRIWTLKEAVSKFFGEGLSFGFNTFSVLPFDCVHTIKEKDIKFFVSEIDDMPLSAAYIDDSDFEIMELFPFDLI